MTHPKRVLIAIDMHCAQAYVAEMTGTHNAPIYRKE